MAGSPQSKSKTEQTIIDDATVTRSEFNTSNKHLEGLIETKTAALGTQISSLASSVNTLASEFRSSQRPQYGNWLSAGSLLAVLMGGFWALTSANTSSVVNQMTMGDEANRMAIEHVANGSNRFSQQDWHREEQRKIEQDRHEELLYVNYQKQQDERIRTLEIDASTEIAAAKEWRRLMEAELMIRGDRLNHNDEKVNRLDEYTRRKDELEMEKNNQ